MWNSPAPTGRTRLEGSNSQGSRPLARTPPWAILDRSSGAEGQAVSFGFAHIAKRILKRALPRILFGGRSYFAAFNALEKQARQLALAGMAFAVHGAQVEELV